MRAAVVFGQFGEVADPVNLPHFDERLQEAGVETILIEHTDTQKAYDFLHGYKGKVALVGASLGAGVVCIMAGYLGNQEVAFVGGFQPSDFDPVMHPVKIEDGNDLITRAVCVPHNVKRALCFRNPVPSETLGLGHATYVIQPTNGLTQLRVVDKEDVHPGDFGEAQDEMVREVLEALK